MFDSIENLLGMSLRLNKSNPLLQTIRQTPGARTADRDPISWNDADCNEYFSTKF